MILRALSQYYQRLADDPDSDVAEYGFSRQQISFVVVIKPDGTLHAINSAQQEDAKGKLRNQLMVVPGNAKPSGSGINPCFLWDNPTYALGYKPDDPKPERTRESFEAFRKRHLEVEQTVDSPEFAAVCQFLKAWDPARAEEHEVLREHKTGFGVFSILGEEYYVHQAPAVHAWWLSQVAEQEANDHDTIGQCLVTGEVGPLARLHEPKIKGVYGGQPAGAALVSFNLDAFDSYGKSQSINAPVSEQTAFRYCTALNRLLDPAGKRRLSVGDTSVVYWTAKPTPVETVLTQYLNPSEKAEDETQLLKLQSQLKAISQGKHPEELGDPKTPFYVLGLAPNAARISVRFWYESTLGEFLSNLGQHYRDLSIAHGPKDRPYPDVWRLIRETARETKDVPDLLEGALMRSILTGGAYPQMFYASLLRRVRADREVRHVRAAAIKACLNRNTRFNINPLSKELPMSLDAQRPEPAYHLGRLFAELEKTQEDALPGINDTIKDRCFSAASSTPGSIFPRLIRLSQHHLGKLEKGAKTYHERRIQEISGHLTGFPMQLSMQQQGLFAIGYYHQRQDLFTKKKSSDSDTGNSAE